MFDTICESYGSKAVVSGLAGCLGCIVASPHSWYAYDAERIVTVLPLCSPPLRCLSIDHQLAIT